MYASAKCVETRGQLWELILSPAMCVPLGVSSPGRPFYLLGLLACPFTAILKEDLHMSLLEVNAFRKDCTVLLG